MESNGTFTGQILAKGRATPYTGMNMPAIPAPVKIQVEQSISFNYQKIIPTRNAGGGGSAQMVAGSWQETNVAAQ